MKMLFVEKEAQEVGIKQQDILSRLSFSMFTGSIVSEVGGNGAVPG